jgi:hypothetical protein
MRNFNAVYKRLQIVKFSQFHTDILATLVAVLILVIVTYSGVYLGNIKFFYVYSKFVTS